MISPSATYAAGVRPQEISLTVTDGGGLTNTMSQTVTVTPPNQPPVASFTSNCANLSCTFNSTGSTDDVGIVSRGWTFGDGTSAGNVVSPSSTYAAPGTYTVSLTVTDGGGLTNTVTHVVTVTRPILPPVASFTATCTNLTCTFNSSASSDAVGIVNRSWSFGDGTTDGNVVSPTVTYAAGGTYKVTLIVTDAAGLTNSATRIESFTRAANQPPVASFTSSCTNLACTFNSTGSTDDVGIVSRAWTFGDGTSAGNVVSPAATYASGGTYTVSLTVTDGGGLTSTVSHVVSVAPLNLPPVASFTSSCTNLACTFNSTGSTDDVGIVSRAWTFGDSFEARRRRQSGRDLCVRRHVHRLAHRDRWRRADEHRLSRRDRCAAESASGGELHVELHQSGLHLQLDRFHR